MMYQSSHQLSLHLIDTKGEAITAEFDSDDFGVMPVTLSTHPSPLLFVKEISQNKLSFAISVIEF